MARKPAQNGNTPKALATLGLESFTMEQIHRSQLADAPYNPRLIGDAEKRKLKAGIKRHGMVTPITWNKKTGNIVGGHQRLHQLDALAGTDNYTLNVATINVALEKEKEINIILNNPETQGSWDLEKLGEILKSPEIDLAGAGFDNADVYRLFGDSLITKLDSGKFDALAEQLEAFRETFKKIDATRTSDEFYFVAVFRTGEDRTAFLKRHGLPDDRYQSGEDLERLIKGEDLPTQPPQAAPSKHSKPQSKGSAQ